MNITDEELYHKISLLNFKDDDAAGFFYKGHVDIVQWERVAKEYMEKEYGIKPSKYTDFRKGWYKVIPNGMMLFLYNKCKGSFPVMECIYE
jgi:hypothetical protein